MMNEVDHLLSQYRRSVIHADRCRETARDARDRGNLELAKLAERDLAEFNENAEIYAAEIRSGWVQIRGET